VDKMLYLGMTGAKHLQLAQATNANNLANASTAGFRADFHSLFTQEVEGPGLATRANAVLGGESVDVSAGAVQTTDNPLDIAINGDGWFAVSTEDGGEAYTRRGDLRISADGLLTNGAGQQILGDGGLLALPEHQSLSIGSDGTVSIVPLGQGPDTQIVIDRIRMVNLDENQISKGQDGLIRQRDGSAGTASAEISLISGALESSNVNAVDAMVNMISLSRAFEMEVKMMSTAGELADAGSRLMRLE
jgi:flagellar basal-body rod protein FlgF